MMKSALASWAARTKLLNRSFPSGTSCAWKSDAMANVTVFSCWLQLQKQAVHNIKKSAMRLFFFIVIYWAICYTIKAVRQQVLVSIPVVRISAHLFS